MNIEGHAKSTKRAAQGPPLGIPPLEIPEGIRELAASSVGQMKESCKRMIGTSEALTEAFERACSIVVRSNVDWAAKVVDAVRINTTEAFDFTTDLLAAKTVSEMVDVTTSHMRKQLDAVSAQSRDFWSLGQRLVAETAKPISSELTKSFEVGAAS